MSKLTLADLTDAERTRLRVAVHEAGHATWAVLSGARVHGITAGADDGVVTFTGEGPHGAEIAYAGIYAEAVFACGGTPSWEDMREAVRNGSAEDREYFGETVRVPRHIEPDIRYVMPKVKALARHLYRHGSATHADVEAALGVTRDVSVALVASCIRSRMGWPVSGGVR
ncbi:M50 family metallopeptidase [Nocardia salmonicida]|uniref:M50 family metallopeptidase n=1 Tax=Nocardia salmonicida TaxID=53431 RepID=UPI002E2A3B0B|nr:M50 family metallopeptidase [Nocardia salmonicida]